MKILKPKKKKPKRTRDVKKDRIFNSLKLIITKAGYEVRREQLKRGPGWKVISGECQAKGSNLIFVDSRMSQDDQIKFLLNKMVTSGIKPDAEELQELPENIQEHFTAVAA